MNEKTKKIVNIVITVVQILIVLLAITVSIIVLVNPNINNGEVSSAKVKLLPVKTNSMNGNEKNSFKAGDLLVAKTPKDPASLNKGDIIVFKTEIGGKQELNTHRIVEKGSYLGTDGKTTIYWYKTKGDARNSPDTTPVYSTEVLAVVTKIIPNVGSAIGWLQQPNNFLVVIIVPLAVLFIYNIILFIRMIMANKLEKAKAEMAIEKSEAEDIKQKAIQEYLASIGVPSGNAPQGEIKKEIAAEEKSAEATEEPVKEYHAPIGVPSGNASSEIKNEIAAEKKTAEATAEPVKEEKPAEAKAEAVKKPAAAKPAAAKPATAKPATAKPATVKPATAKPAAAKNTAAKPAAQKPDAAKAPSKNPTAPKAPKAE